MSRWWTHIGNIWEDGKHLGNIWETSAKKKANVGCAIIKCIGSMFDKDLRSGRPTLRQGFENNKCLKYATSS